MTIVKSSFSNKRKLLPKGSKKHNSDLVDIFSNSQLTNIKSKDLCNVSIVHDENLSEDSLSEEENSQVAKPDLKDLFAAIEKRLKKKTCDQKRAMENDMKKTISKTVDEMNERVSNIGNQINQKLTAMKFELEQIHQDREKELDSLKEEYESFQVMMEKAIEKLDFGEKRIQLIRDRFLADMIEFNANFDFPKEKLEELFENALKEGKKSKKESKHLQ